MLNELLSRYPQLKVCEPTLIEAVSAIIDCYKNGGKILLCGNGGSCADCDHIVGELMKGFLKNLYLRPSCYQCMARQGKSGADIAIADYWGIQRIHPGLDDDKGVNLVLINTQKGQTYFDAIVATLTYTISDYRKAIANNPCIVKSVAEPSQRVQFWREYERQGIACIDGICQSMTPSKFSVLFGRIVRKLKSFVR